MLGGVIGERIRQVIDGARAAAGGKNILPRPSLIAFKLSGLGVIAQHAVYRRAGALGCVAARGNHRARSGDVEFGLRRCRSDTDEAGIVDGHANGGSIGAIRRGRKFHLCRQVVCADSPVHHDSDRGTVIPLRACIAAGGNQRHLVAGLNGGGCGACSTAATEVDVAGIARIRCVSGLRIACLRAAAVNLQGGPRCGRPDADIARIEYCK